MKKRTERSAKRRIDRDTLRREYDFGKARRGITAARYRGGANVVVIDPDVLDVFPDAASVNEALRAIAPVLRSKNRTPAPAKRRHD